MQNSKINGRKSIVLRPDLKPDFPKNWGRETLISDRYLCKQLDGKSVFLNLFLQRSII